MKQTGQATWSRHLFAIFFFLILSRLKTRNMERTGGANPFQNRPPPPQEKQKQNHFGNLVDVFKLTSSNKQQLDIPAPHLGVCVCPQDTPICEKCTHSYNISIWEKEVKRWMASCKVLEICLNTPPPHPLRKGASCALSLGFLEARSGGRLVLFHTSGKKFCAALNNVGKGQRGTWILNRVSMKKR